ASALRGAITDPRDWAAEVGLAYPELALPQKATVNTRMLEEPLPLSEAREVELVKGANISSLPELDALPDNLHGPVLLKVGDDISTDEISPAGARALPFRSNIPKLATFAFDVLDPDYASRATAHDGPHLIVGGSNYGQG